VHEATAESGTVASAVISTCDGLPIRDFLQRRLLTQGFRPAEAGMWWFRVPRAFTSVPITAQGRPQRCTFEDASGNARQVALRWSPAPEDINTRLSLATDGERTPIGLTESRPGLFLVGMPDFQPDDAGAEAYRALYVELERRREDLMKARAVVIDLRHNNGGSSAWSRDAARVLFGRAAVDERMQRFFNDVTIWWRASPANVRHWEQLAAKLREEGKTAQADSVQPIAASMRSALDRGERFWVQPVGKGIRQDLPPLPSTDFVTPVYVITPGRCASACLDALDVFTRFPYVKLIGAPTSADSIYMEVRNETLPSGRGRIVIPVKAWLGRPRGAGEVYRPHIPFNERDWSTAAFLDRVEQDLTRN
jgi:hypothetical protein